MKETDWQKQRGRPKKSTMCHLQASSWPRCHWAPAPEALGMRSASPPSHLQHGPWLIIGPPGGALQRGEDREGELFVTSKLGLSVGSLKDLEHREENRQECTNVWERNFRGRGWCSNPPVYFKLPLCFLVVYMTYTVPPKCQSICRTDGVVQHNLTTCDHNTPLTAFVHCSQKTPRPSRFTALRYCT